MRIMVPDSSLYGYIISCNQDHSIPFKTENQCIYLYRYSRFISPVSRDQNCYDSLYTSTDPGQTAFDIRDNTRAPSNYPTGNQLKTIM